MDGRPEPARLLRDAAAGLVDAHTWRSLGYVSLAVLTRIVLLAVSLVLVVAALALCLVGVGIPLMVGVHLVVNRMVGLERGMAGIVGRSIPGRPPSTGRMLDRFRDSNRWREVGFAVSAWLPTTLLLALVLVAWGVPIYLLSVPLWGWAVRALSWPEIVLMAAAGAGLLLLAPSITVRIGHVLARYTESAVGPDRLVAMEQRMEDVSRNRQELLTAVADERRRIERNLHDGVQQQLVALGIDLGLAQAKLESDPDTARALLLDATKKTRETIGELRVIGRGLHPAILGDRGLDAALSAVVSSAAIPVELTCELSIHPPAPIQEAAYFVVSEALANVMKHSGANVAVVKVVAIRGAAPPTGATAAPAAADTAHLAISIYDDGRGGADLSGTGLAGIAARVQGLQGTFDLSSPPGGPTIVTAMLPFAVFTDQRRQ